MHLAAHEPRSCDPGRRCPTPATVRPQRFSRSRRFPPRNPVPGLFHPGNAPGVSPSGLCSSAGEPYLSRGRLLSCRSLRARGRSATRTDRGSRALIPPESPFCDRPKPRRSRCPPGVDPSKAFPSSGASRNRCPACVFSRTRARVPRILPCTSPAGLAPDTAVLRSIGPPEFLASPSCEGASLPGVSHLVPVGPLRTRPGVGDRSAEPPEPNARHYKVGQRIGYPPGRWITLWTAFAVCARRLSGSMRGSRTFSKIFWHAIAQNKRERPRHAIAPVNVFPGQILASFTGTREVS